MKVRLDSRMKKPMLIMLIVLGVLFGGIFLYKGVMSLLMKRFFASMENPVITVSTAKVAYSNWEPKLKAVGSMRATLGVNVTAQLGGMIQTIYFTPGATVTEGTLLVQQNADPNIAQLHALEANAELARITYERDKKQYKVKAVSKQQLDTDLQNLKSLRAQVAQQAAIVEQLTIKAPFGGRLGISKVNPGQYLNPGDTVVTLQRLDPIYADFYLPQQALARLKVGQKVNITVDAFPKKTFTGKITTINPLVQTDTRNVEVEATIANPKMELAPGMFSNVEIITDKSKPYLTVPQTAISFNPYGDIVYVVKEKKDKDGKTVLTANQVFVTTGESRGDQIMVLKGIKEGDIIVTSGQLKLKNGSYIAINNSVQPANNPSPKVSNEHDG
ncbi:efflux RND transporter periplasmic adaptor subunit [Aquicella lusitana]|uniref:Membrane fusion protein (Multidrug efflux system) n=1 Tax=Aquicella lusitana TaxID=254246 RepID=A0A370GGB8_9COXI|nr:efflux RND transporter periplasmic adaptor subunit [Aquicella lusitana]RDI42845.1 membrane fusion protein (multidrug efflux system) [Aquicella lusitana]VVC73088.1 Multidrug resistance protein MdtE [Aquicella lusitana]